MTHFYVWRDSFICITWLIHTHYAMPLRFLNQMHGSAGKLKKDIPGKKQNIYTYHLVQNTLIFVCVYIYEGIHKQVNTYGKIIYIHEYVWYIFIKKNIQMFVDINKYTWIYIHICICKQMYIYIYIYIARIYICIYKSIHIYIYIYVYMCKMTCDTFTSMLITSPTCVPLLIHV